MKNGSCQCLGVGVKKLMFKRDRVSLWEDEKSSGDGWWGGLHNKVNVLNDIELHR